MTSNTGALSLLGVLSLLALVHSQAQNQPTPNHDTREIIEKLEAIVIPVVDFKETPVREAFDFLRDQSRAHDKSTGTRVKGVNFVLKLDDEQASRLVTLDLNEVPLREALRYVCTVANLKYRVEPHAILVVNLLDPSF
jgi:general secretion pathway protein D